MFWKRRGLLSSLDINHDEEENMFQMDFEVDCFDQVLLKPFEMKADLSIFGEAHTLLLQHRVLLN